MLPKKNRLDKKALETLFKVGRVVQGKVLSLRFTTQEGQKIPRVAVIAPKSVAKLATKRSSLRRRGYAAIEKELKHLPRGLIGAIVFKKLPNSTEEVAEDVSWVLNKTQQTRKQ